MDDEQTAVASGAGEQGISGRVLALKAEQARQQRKWDDDIAEHIAHDALFMTVGEFGQEIVRRHRLQHSEAWLLAYEVLKAHPDLELFCRWEDSFRWSPLPPCPVAPGHRLHDKNGRYYNGKFGHMGPTYMHPVRDGSIPSPDPLASVLGQENSTGWWPTDCLAIRRDFAELLLGTPTPPADDTEPSRPLTPAPAPVQSVPAAAPEQRAGPVWKNGDEWTPAAVAEMARLYEQDGHSLSAIGLVMGNLVGGPAISRQRVREKIPDAVRGGKGKCKGARG